MLKYEGKFSVGDYIRAYDFAPRTDMDPIFIEGTITGITDDVGFKAYEIIVQKDSAEFYYNAESRKGLRMFVPMEVCFLEYDGRITKRKVK